MLVRLLELEATVFESGELKVKDCRAGAGVSTAENLMNKQSH